MPIINKEFKIAFKGDSKHLLDFLESYFERNAEGEVLRFAITGIKNKTLHVNASVRTKKRLLASMAL